MGEGQGEELSRLIEKYIREAFDERSIGEELSEKLWRYYYKYLAGAIDLGYSPTLEQYDPKLALSLKYNIAEFSAFKETSFKKQIEATLTKNGRVLSWSEFRKEADKLNVQYNRRWLQTEYHQTIANAQAAEKFQGYVAEKSVYPNLKYRTINDERTREKHRAWDGLTLPVEHPFWQKHLPPNDWGCRCYVEQTAEPASEGIVANENIKAEFANNPALSGQIFSKIPYDKTFSDTESKAIREKVKERLERDIYTPKVIKEYENGGKIISSNLVNADGSDYERVYKCCEFFAKQGKEATILPRFNSPLKSEVYKQLYKELKGTPYWGKCPDFKVGNVFYEHEGFLGSTSEMNFKKAFKKATDMISKGIKQSDRIVIDYTPCDYNSVKRSIEKRISENQNISEVWVLQKDDLKRIY
ncbi:hypothetical protein CAPN002_05980 [Capnocytophaga stomatis]|nr:hypothetical protein CAPN002_05980 [Capnocytophaga stomatis]